MNLSVSLGRSMAAIGFAILLLVALSACSKKKAVDQSGDVGIFVIALPDQSNPSLRDYNGSDLPAGTYEVSRLGFRVESWPSNANPAFKAEFRQTLSVIGVISPIQDQIEFSNVRTDGGVTFPVEFSFEFQDSVTLSYSGASGPNYGYRVIIEENKFDAMVMHGDPNLDKISAVLKDENRTARGIYKSGGIEAYVVQNNNGFSVFFVVYGNFERAIGRIDYLYTGP